MPRSSGVEITQRRAARVPSQLRTSSSDSDPLNHRSKTDRSPKLGGTDRRSPRGGALSDPPVNQKKLGTRIDHLESQLGQAQEELKNLKEQLVSAEDAKKAAQEQLEGKSKKAVAPEPGEIQEKKCSQKAQREDIKSNNSSCVEYEVSEENEEETDVFEVLVEKVAIEAAVELSQPTKEGAQEIKAEIESPNILEIASFDELAQKDGEINALKAKLAEKEEELGAFCKENESLKIQLEEKSSEISSAQSKEEDMIVRLNQVIKELEESKNNAFQIHQKWEVSENTKAALETEMKKLRVQTEQWRKAADAAAAVLSGDVDMNGRKVSERSGSMDKHIGGNILKSPLGRGYLDDYIGSPGMIDDTDDGFGAGKRKASGIRMFGDLWKKKGQK